METTLFTSQTNPTEKREFPRLRLHNVSGKLKDGFSGASSTVEMFDISVGGISFLAPVVYSKEVIWIFRLSLSNEQIINAIQIVDCIQYPFLANLYRISAEFKDIDFHQAQVIREFINHANSSSNNPDR